MIYPVERNLIHLLENLVAAIRPFASANSVQLYFITALAKATITYHPEFVLQTLAKLLYRVITLTPQEQVVTIELQASDPAIRIRVSNTGVFLDQLRATNPGYRHKIAVSKGAEGGTVFEILFPKEKEEANPQKEKLIRPFIADKQTTLPFFKRLKNNLRSYFTSIQHRERATAHSEREDAFLKKINTVIMAHLDQEHFDLPALSKAMALSRSQLYRRLKPLLQQGPARYIRFLRLQKAKELLESSDRCIGEVAFQTGFLSQSHFTRAFHEQFGFNPSDLKRSKTPQKDCPNEQNPNLKQVEPNSAHS